jgi:acetyltransferase-like isoleucine patch superfamily enzyme
MRREIRGVQAGRRPWTVDGPRASVRRPVPPAGTVIEIANVLSKTRHGLRTARVRLAVWRARRAGATIGEGCRFSGLPIFGSEPWLITIGRNVNMAGEVVFITHDGGIHVFRRKERYRKVIKYGRIDILDNCVIGYRAIILPGVTIGPDSVVGAGAVVSRSVPPGVVVSGNPAKAVMTVHQYAEWALAATPDYDESEYARDQRTTVTRLYPHRPVPKRPARKDAKATED